MKQITVTTGFGYFRDSEGKIICKAELPKGQHHCKDEYEYFEVIDKQELNAVQVFVPEPTQQELDEQKIREKMRQLAVDSLKDEGKLPPDWSEPYAKS